MSGAPAEISEEMNTRNTSISTNLSKMGKSKKNQTESVQKLGRNQRSPTTTWMKSTITIMLTTTLTTEKGKTTMILVEGAEVTKVAVTPFGLFVSN